MKVFNIIAIGCDSQGGGYAIEEALHDMDKLKPGELPIWPVIDPDKESDTDHQPGKHMLHMIQFSSGEWTSQSNHGMKKDMQDKTLLFPEFDSIILGLACEKEKDELERTDSNYDTLEDCMLEIEELKDELSIITRVRTPAGRERWDTPDIKVSNTRKEKMRKDRYSALLIANAVARITYRELPPPQYNCVGAAVGTKPSIADGKAGQMYISEWYSPSPDLFGAIQR